MQVKVTPGYSSSGRDHHIEDGFMVLNKVVEEIYLDGEKVSPEHERYYEVKQVIDESPKAVYFETS